MPSHGPFRERGIGLVPTPIREYPHDAKPKGENDHKYLSVVAKETIPFGLLNGRQPKGIIFPGRDRLVALVNFGTNGSFRLLFLLPEV